MSQPPDTTQSLSAPVPSSPDAFATDVVIIGAGPVGLFTVFQLGMLRIRAQVVDSLDVIGGQLTALYPEKPIYDIPGYPEVSAATLVEKLAQQAAPFQPRYHLGQQVERLTPLPEGEGRSGGWRVETSRGVRIDCRAVVLAAGAGAFGPNRPPLAGIENYEGRGPGQGVHYAVQRREDFKGRRIVIAGGGDSALDWTLALAPTAERIYLVHRRAKFRAAPESVARMEALCQAADSRVERVIPYQLHGLEGRDGRLEAVTVADLDGKPRRLEADCLLPFFGLSTDLGPIARWDLNLERNCVTVDPLTCESSTSGIFAVGDIATYPRKLKLILNGFAEAALAAHAIHPLVHPQTALHWEYSTTKGVSGFS